MNTITMNLNADNLIRQALQEDITSEDITTNAVMREAKAGRSSASVQRGRCDRRSCRLRPRLHPAGSRN